MCCSTELAKKISHGFYSTYLGSIDALTRANISRVKHTLSFAAAWLVVLEFVFDHTPTAFYPSI
jgi:hypothetical protein